MKLRSILFCAFIFIISLEINAQESNYDVKAFPNPYDSLITFDVVVKENDTFNLTIYNRFGSSIFNTNQILCETSKNKTYKIDSIENGVQIGSLTINAEKLPRKIVFNGNKNSAILNLNIRVIKNNENIIKVYPNPIATETLNLELESTSDNIEILVYSIDGKLIHKERYSNPFGLLKKTLNTSAWNSGQYILKMRTEGNEKEVKVIKTVE